MSKYVFGPREFDQEEWDEAISLIDGAMEVVKLFGYNSPHEGQKQWAKEWLEKAKKLGGRFE